MPLALRAGGSLFLNMFQFLSSNTKIGYYYTTTYTPEQWEIDGVNYTRWELVSASFNDMWNIYYDQFYGDFSGFVDLLYDIIQEKSLMYVKTDFVRWDPQAIPILKKMLTSRYDW